MEETAQVENVPAVHVEQQKTWLTFQDGARSTAGIKTAVNALFRMKVEEMLMPCFTTLTTLLMSDFGKLTKSIGVHAVEEEPHVTFSPI